MTHTLTVNSQVTAMVLKINNKRIDDHTNGTKGIQYQKERVTAVDPAVTTPKTDITTAAVTTALRGFNIAPGH